jgi:hypothetical protein
MELKKAMQLESYANQKQQIASHQISRFNNVNFGSILSVAKQTNIKFR